MHQECLASTSERTTPERPDSENEGICPGMQGSTAQSVFLELYMHKNTFVSRMIKDKLYTMKETKFCTHPKHSTIVDAPRDFVGPFLGVNVHCDLNG